MYVRGLVQQQIFNFVRISHMLTPSMWRCWSHICIIHQEHLGWVRVRFCFIYMLLNFQTCYLVLQHFVFICSLTKNRRLHVPNFGFLLIIRNIRNSIFIVILVCVTRKRKSWYTSLSPTQGVRSWKKSNTWVKVDKNRIRNRWTSPPTYFTYLDLAGVPWTCLNVYDFPCGSS